MIRDEKRNNENLKLRNIGKYKTSRQLWNHVKQQGGWIKSLSPTVLTIEGQPILDNTQILDTLNTFETPLKHPWKTLGHP